jgi:branched-chain amino acid transport system substrate-binding protein
MSRSYLEPIARGAARHARIKGLLFVCPALLAAALCLLLAASTWAQTRNPGAPNFEARKHPAEYLGPGREEKEPANLSEIRIGYFGPDNPEHPAGGSIRQGIELALDEANLENGYRGIPFRLISAWSENQWSTGVSSLTRLVFYDRVWAVIGGIDGPSTHLAEQVVVKARLPLISPISSDKTATLANVPWIFSLSPGDHAIAPVIAEMLVKRLHGSPFVVLSANDHDSQLLFREVKLALVSRTSALQHHLQFRSGGACDPGFVAEVLRRKPRAVVLLAGVEDSARMLVAMRSEGFDGDVIGGPAMARSVFPALAGSAVEGVALPALDEPGEHTSLFEKRFCRRYGKPPDYAAAQGYDSVQLLVAAIRKAGLNRARIGDALRALSPWPGVSGSIRWDGGGQNTRTARPATIQAGRVWTSSRDKADSNGLVKNSY